MNATQATRDAAFHGDMGSSLAVEPSKPPSAPSPAFNPPVAILGVPFDPLTLEEAVQRIAGLADAPGPQPHYVVTANVDFLVQAQHDDELRRVLLEADMVLCDGMPVLWASRWLGNPLPERVAGSDVVPRLLRVAADRGHRVFLLGAGPGVAARAAERLKRDHPSLRIVGHYTPPFAPLLEMNHDWIVRRIRESKPDLLLVSLGCPKQEKWIAMHYRSLGVPVVIGVGATIDFLAGRMKRAPLWMRRSGFEWLHRLMQEPGRLCRRYAGDLLRFVPALTAQWCRLRAAHLHSNSSTSVSTCSCRSRLRVNVSGPLNAAALRKNARLWREIMDTPRPCLLDLSGVPRIDSTAVGFLTSWRKQLRASGHDLVLLAPHRSVRRALKTMRLHDHFLIASHLNEARALTPVSRMHPPPVRLNGDSRPLAWQGEVTAANADEIRLLTAEKLRPFCGHCRRVVIDLSGVRFLDTTGAGLMLQVRAWARQARTEVLFAGARPVVQNVLRLARLDRLLLEDAA